MSDKIKPTVKENPEITITAVQQPTIEPGNGQYAMVAIDPAGNEKPNTQFSISPKGFDKHYKHLTLVPDGAAQLGTAQFKLKKNPN